MDEEKDALYIPIKKIAWYFSVAKVKAIRASLRIHHQVVSKLQYVSVMEHAGQS